MWPWELYEMLNLAAAVERAARVRHHPLRSRLLPDVAGVHAPVADAGRPDAAPRAERRRESRCGRAIRRRRSSPSRNEQARLLRRPQRRRRRARTASTPTASRSATTPDDYLLFLGRFTAGKGVLQAIEVARRARHAAAARRRRGPVLPRARRAARRRDNRSSMSAKPTSTTKVKLYGGARALLYPVQAGEPFGLVLAEAMACGTPVAALDRGAVREVVDDGVTGMRLRRPRRDGRRARRACWRSTAAASTRAPSQRFGVEPHGRRVRTRVPHGSSISATTAADDRRATLAGRIVLAVFAHPDDESLACGGTLARLADAGARVVLMCASHGERGSADRAGARRRARPRAGAGDCARPRRRSASSDVVVCRPSRRRSALGARRRASTPTSCSFMRRHTPAAVITFGEDGLYWHLDHIGVHERTIDGGPLARR